MSYPTLYFAFGSNLWKQQMSRRCPSSTYLGIGRLRGYEWFINARGYANIAPSSANNTSTSTSTSTSNGPDSRAPPGQGLEGEVWGLVYALTPDDEARLDASEGVPHAYQRQAVLVEFWPATGSPPPSSPSPAGAGAGAGAGPGASPGTGPGREVPMLVYVDGQRNQGGYPPRAEYVHRMNEGIDDALAEGVPAEYVERVLRRYIPPRLGEEA
ncbi:hypothetical protein VTH06DRAFT_8724 [Thermothelomyces fergusii]